MPSYDSPWKEALYQHLRPMLTLLFPRLAGRIDWREDHHPLEQELRKIAPEGEIGVRLADALIRVRMLTGDERILHAEAQAQACDEAEFCRRVYVYNYRAHDQFNLPVESLVILGDDDPDWMPTTHVERHDYSKTVFEFEPVKLLRWADRLDELRQHENPMALFVLAHLESMRTRKDDAERARVKLDLLVRLKARKLDAEDVRQWNRYLDWLLELPRELDLRVLAEYQALTKETDVEKRVHGMTWPEFISFPERLGIEKGEKQGEIKGLVAGIEAVLEVRFGTDGVGLMPEVRKVEDPDRLKELLTAAKSKPALDDVRALLTPPASAAP
jgi:hypothetical protein